MTEQFTPEYIAYILKAKALQALWMPAVGDAFLVHATGATEVILDWDARDTGVWTIQLGIGAGSTKHFWTRGTICGPGAVWLPTLFQLIRVIEGAGFHWYRRTNETWGIHREGDADRWEVNAYGDDLLAAAQLAVRAVEEK